MNETIKEFKAKQKELIDKIIIDPSHLNYWNSYKKIKKLIVNNNDIKNLHNFKIALLSSFTIDPLESYLDIDSRLIDLYPHIYIGPFNQYQQDILSESKLYQHNPEIIIFFIQIESILNSMFLPNFPKMTLEQKEDEISKTINLVINNLEILMNKTNATIIFSNFIVPTFSPFGILDNKIDIGYKKFYSIINDKLESFAKNNSQLFILDLNGLASKFGKNLYLNYPMWYRGSFLFADKFLPLISYEIMGFFKAIKGKNRKGIVLDLDNTLWGGIIGEDGIDGIKLNNNYPGNEFVEFQKTILSLYNRGIILALNSKNDESYAWEAIKKHPAMVLKEDNIGSYRINWQDKATNIIEIADELNIGLDSLVFIDDNPVERERVKSSASEVLTVDLPSSPANYKKTLEELNDFNSLTLTAEDLKRGEMYFARKKRKDVEKKVQSIEDFIRTLEICITIKLVSNFSLPRVTSLINKTNQFNLTTRRYNESEVNEIVSSPDKLIYSIQVVDKYGDEGIVGVAIVHKGPEWIIDNILMSCRVIGRKIESAFLIRILKDAFKEKINIIQGEFVPSKKNDLVKKFYENHRFTKIEEKTDGSSKWSIKITEKELKYPEYLKIVEE